jgi:endogenous inhibitor of DNA gyrase (YacG/DUF329 family)
MQGIQPLKPCRGCWPTMGMGMGTEAGFAKRRRPCPVSDKRLYEMHWRDQLTLREMGHLLQADASMVTKWMKRAHVSIRSPSAAGRLSATLGRKVLPYGEWRERINSTLSTAAAEWREGHRNELMEILRRGQARVVYCSKKNAGSQRVPCAVCGTNVYRAGSRLRRQKAVTCSVRCRQRFSSDQGRLTLPCEWCGEAVTRLRSDFKKPHVFCSKSHASYFRHHGPPSPECPHQELPSTTVGVPQPMQTVRRRKGLIKAEEIGPLGEALLRAERKADATRRS